MDVRASRIVRVVIAGDWIMVEPGTFQVQEFILNDDSGAPMNRSKEPAYYFETTDGDPYFGPMSAIQLIKLRPASLEFDGGEGSEQTAGESHALPVGDSEPEEAPKAPIEAPAVPEPEPEPAKINADDLFADPLPTPGAEPDRKKGLL